MRLHDFDDLVGRLAAELPPEFLDGIAGIEVSRKTLPHPLRGEIYTMGECVPLPDESGSGTATVQSRIILYHGSFQALAALDRDFDWRREAWETLTHELRHHLEWRARAADLEAFDWAAEQNFARGDGEPFDPDFPRAGEAVAEGVFRIDDDFFLERIVNQVPVEIPLTWHGAAYRIDLPPEVTLPAFLVVDGVREPPPGELVLVLRRQPGLGALLRRRAVPFVGQVEAIPA